MQQQITLSLAEQEMLTQLKSEVTLAELVLWFKSRNLDIKGLTEEQIYQLYFIM
jgi:hypothetical protein